MTYKHILIVEDEQKIAAILKEYLEDGTVTDTSTDLMWQQVSSSNKIWEQALAYCEGLSLGDYTDWRLPTSKELQSLVDYSWYSPAINTTYFSNTAASGYWSSTPDVGNTHAWGGGCAWSVTFDFGSVGIAFENNRYDVRAVRGGQPIPLDHLVISVSPSSRNMAKDTGATTFSYDHNKRLYLTSICTE